MKNDKSQLCHCSHLKQMAPFLIQEKGGLPGDRVRPDTYRAIAVAQGVAKAGDEVASEANQY
jgi:hypothetical protein